MNLVSCQHAKYQYRSDSDTEDNIEYLDLVSCQHADTEDNIEYLDLVSCQHAEYQYRSDCDAEDNIEYSDIVTCILSVCRVLVQKRQ